MAIVIVDDDSTMRHVARRLLEGAGLKVLGEASSGREALAMVEVLKPAVVLMDGRIPLMHGATIISGLRKTHPDLSVIAHTADPNLAEEMAAAGASCVVVRGSPGQLVEVVGSWMSQGGDGHLKAVGRATTGAARLRAALFRHAEFHPEGFPPESVPGDDNEGWWLDDGSLAIRLTAIPRIAADEGLANWMEHLLELRQRGEIVAGPSGDGVARTINGTRAVVFSPVA